MKNKTPTTRLTLFTVTFNTPLTYDCIWAMLLVSHARKKTLPFLYYISHAPSSGLSRCIAPNNVHTTPINALPLVTQVCNEKRKPEKVNPVNTSFCVGQFKITVL